MPQVQAQLITLICTGSGTANYTNMHKFRHIKYTNMHRFRHSKYTNMHRFRHS